MKGYVVMLLLGTCNKGHRMSMSLFCDRFFFSHKRFIDRTGRLVEIAILPTDEVWDNMLHYCGCINGAICDSVHLVMVWIL